MSIVMDVSCNITSLLLVGALTVFLLVIFLRRHHEAQLPPAPRALPVIGHFHLLSDKKKPLHQILHSLSTKYGPIMRLSFGSRPVLVVSNTKLAKECFGTNDLSFASRPQLAQGKHLGYNFSILGWAPYGPYWRNVRKICALELLSSKRIQSFRPKRLREISKTITSLFEEGRLESTVNMRNVLSQLTFRILMSMIIDDRYFGEESGISLVEVTRMIEESFMLHGVVNIGDYIPWLRWLDLQGYEKAMKTVQEKLNSYMQRIVEKHRQERLKAGGEREEMDFIDVLISQSENNEAIPDKDAFVKATAIVMFSAGSDTSSVALEWALSLLLRHPHVMKKAQKELDSKVGQSRLVEEDDLPRLKYLQAIVKETLRLYPSAPLLLPHKSIEACTIGGFHFPAGTMLIANAWAIHRDPTVWKKPLEFMPERFMEREIEIDNIHMGGNEFGMIPFGEGRRGCPGAALAMCMLQISLARLLHSFDWAVPDGVTVDMTEGIGVTIPRAVPLEVIIKPRLPLHLYETPSAERSTE